MKNRESFEEEGLESLWVVTLSKEGGLLLIAFFRGVDICWRTLVGWRVVLDVLCVSRSNMVDFGWLCFCSDNMINTAYISANQSKRSYMYMKCSHHTFTCTRNTPLIALPFGKHLERMTLSAALLGKLFPGRTVSL